MVLKFEKEDFIKIRWKGIDCYALKPDYFGVEAIKVNVDNQTIAEEVIEEIVKEAIKEVAPEPTEEELAEIEKEKKRAELEAQLKALE